MRSVPINEWLLAVFPDDALKIAERWKRP